MEQVLIGSILGDGSIDKFNTYHEIHCLEQNDYLLWKKKVFDKKLKIKTKMKYYEQINYCQLYIPRKKIFEEYRKLCYPNGKKIISNKLIKGIGKLAICIWYFDDGSYCSRSNKIVICTYCFSLKENKKLQRMLKKRFGLNFGINHRSQGDQYYLVCNSRDVDKFLKFIKKNSTFIPKSLRYKLGKFDKRNLKSIEENKKRVSKIRCNYYHKNRKEIRKAKRNYYQKNRLKILQYNRKYQK